MKIITAKTPKEFENFQGIQCHECNMMLDNYYARYNVKTKKFIIRIMPHKCKKQGVKHD